MRCSPCPAVLVAAASLALLGGAAPARAGADVELKFAFSTAHEDELRLTRQEIERYNAAHPDVHVTLLPQLWEGYDVFDSYVRFLALEDPSVDVYMIDLPWVPEFAEPRWLLPLDAPLGPEVDRFAPNALAWGRYHGQLYALPFDYKSNLLIYRADLLARHQIPPPRTILDLDRAARRVQAADGVPVGLALHGMYLHNDVLPFFFASGGDVLDAAGRPVLASDVNRRTLAALLALFDGDPPVAPPRAELGTTWARRYATPVEVFGRGDAVFLIAWTRDLRALEAGSEVAGKIGYAAVPGLAPGPGGSNHGSWYLAVARASRHHAEALAFVRFMTSPAIQRERLDQLGEVPTRLELLDDPAIRARYPHVAGLRPILDVARPRPRVPNERAVDAVLEEALHRAVRGASDPASALAEADRRLREDVLVLPAPRRRGAPGDPPRRRRRPLTAPGPHGHPALVVAGCGPW